MKLTKKLLILVAALMISASMAACGSTPKASETASSEVVASEAASSDVASDVASVEAPVEAAPSGEQMTEEAYKAKVLELFNNVTASAAGMATVDQNDFEAVMKETMIVFEETKVSYTELANLNAPDSFADAQADFKVGVDASLKVMEMSIEMIELSNTEMTEEEMTTLATEYQAKIAEITPDVQKLNDALVAVLGADVVSAAATTVQ